MADEKRRYDLVVIGGGPAGIFGATTASALGKSVALVDNHHDLGGAGINTGTVPSKTLRETALTLTGARSRNIYDVDLSLRREATVADFLRHELNVKAGLNTILSQRMESSEIDVYCGMVSFEDPHTVRVRDTRAEKAGSSPVAEQSGELLYGENLLIATGSAPVRPATFPFGAGVYDSDTILQLQSLPKTMAVVGAGVIGSEYACTFAALGAHVHLIDPRDVLLPFLDAEVSRVLTAVMERNGIVFHWKERVQSCNAQAPTTDGNPGTVTLNLTSGAVLTVDEVLVAAGRESRVGDLNLGLAGVTTGERGLIPVDEYYRTNIPHIYAAGDVIGFPALASTSMEQARRAVRHALCSGSASGTPHLLPNGIYTIPEVGMVGETEESLKRQSVDYVVGRAFYRDTARGRILGDADGFLKLLFRREDLKLLGVHVMGEQATEVVHIGLMAMLADGAANLFEEACFNFPTLSELYKLATIAATNARCGSRERTYPLSPEDSGPELMRQSGTICPVPV